MQRTLKSTASALGASVCPDWQTGSDLREDLPAIESHPMRSGPVVSSDLQQPFKEPFSVASPAS
jgi:hypothetical protein